MLGLLSVVLLAGLDVRIPALDHLAVNRDVEGLRRYASQALLSANPTILDFVRTGGSYGVGKYGWHVYSLADVDGKERYAVFSTPLTCEDLGEQVFNWSGNKLTGLVREDNPLGFRIVRNDISASFELPAKRAHFEDHVRIERLSGGRSSLLIRMSDHYKVTSVTDQTGSAVSFAQAGGVVSVSAPAGARQFEYTIRYGGVVDLYQYAGSVSSQEIILAQDYWYPTIARWPAPYHLAVTTPSNWAVIGQGKRIASMVGANTRRTEFEMDVPIVYYSFSAGPFKQVADTLNGRTYTTSSMTMSIQDMHVENLLQADVVEFYDKQFAPYPFKTWGMVFSKPYGSGALEAYSYATWGEASTPFEDSHEPSHTWWGGLLPNTYLHSQWNESFADYSESLFDRERDLGYKPERRLAFIRDSAGTPAFNAAPVAEGSPDIGPGAGALGYGKGAMVLQMLEWELGTPKMVETMREFIRAHKNGEAVEWPDFEAAVDRATGKSFKWFFDQWLRRPGYPDFQVANLRWENGSLKGRTDFHGPRYRLDCEVLIEFPDGKRTIRHVELGGDSDDFSIDLPEKPVLASFDPWRRLLRAYHDDEHPIELSSMLQGFKRYSDPAHTDWLDNLPKTGETVNELPSTSDGVLFVGSPETMPIMASLCASAGFEVRGNLLTYKGTTIDLRKGAALAIVDLPEGGHCAIGLGKTRLAPTMGRSRLCLVDDYGRFLRGVSEPKTSGFLTFNLI